MSTLIYVVKDVETNRHRLIRAGQDDLVSLLTSGVVPIELAGAPATADMVEDTITNAGGTD